jgi:hypothetical protein
MKNDDDNDDDKLSFYFMTQFHNAAYCGTTEQPLGTGLQTKFKTSPSINSVSNCSSYNRIAVSHNEV